MNRFEKWWRAAKPKWWGGAPPLAAPIRVEPVLRAPMKISQAAVERFRTTRKPNTLVNPYVLPTYAPGVQPAAEMAQDSGSLTQQTQQIQPLLNYGGQFHGLFAEGIGFMGYPYLAALAQRSEYRNASEIMAEEMTRKWIKISAVGKEKSKKVQQLEAAIERFNLREVFRNALELDGFFGLSFIRPDFGDADDDDELATRLLVSNAKIAKGSLKGFVVVDPTWCSPNRYNSTNPLDPTFFKPQQWWVMGKQVHASRLLTIISRPLPDMLKPAYNFGGLSLSQMMKPYVDNWLRARQSVSDLMNAFTVFLLETNMMAALGGGNGGEEAARVGMFTQFRDNMGLFVVDKETEALSNISAPLGTLDKLQAQAQEHMAAPERIPLVKLFGITPSGLNASSDGEIRSFYDTVHGKQERVVAPPLKVSLDIIQLSEFGEIDPDIRFEFVPLWQLDEAAKAAVEKTKAETRMIYAEGGAVDAEEVREALAAETESPFHGIDLSGQAPGRPGMVGGEEFGGGEAPNEPIGEQRVGDSALGFDAEFREEDHPRDDDGKFGSGSGQSRIASPPTKSNASSNKSAMKITRLENGKRVQENGHPLPAHIEKLKIPPAWTDVKYDDKPGAALLAVGKDSKGRSQAVYSDEFTATQAAAKFGRIEELRREFSTIVAQNAEGQKSHNPKVRDAADCLDLIMKMGVRPGSETDTGAKVKAYGATTLEGRHVVKAEDGVYLRFVGKKGVPLNLRVDDAALADRLLERAHKSGADGKLFPAVSDKSLLDYTHTMGGGHFKTKDFRTHLGTATAYDLVAQSAAPKNEREYEKAVKEIGKKVSQKLGNTPIIALQSYINPVVFAAWREAVS